MATKTKKCAKTGEHKGCPGITLRASRRCVCACHREAAAQ